MLKVSVTLVDLTLPDAQLTLIEGERNYKINAPYSVDKVYIATMLGQKESAPRRIPFWRPPDLGLVDVDQCS